MNDPFLDMGMVVFNGPGGLTLYALECGEVADPFGAPPHHSAAVAYMMAHPGTSYEKSCEIVLAGGRPGGHQHEEEFAMSGPADIYSAPPHHQAAVDYMMAHPGTTYERSCEVVLADQNRGAGSGFSATCHDRAIAYMMEHPGTSYGQAVAVVLNDS